MHRKLVISICLILSLMMGRFSIGGDAQTLSRGKSLAGSQKLTSKNGMFELGFFQPSGSSPQNRFYLSIRYTGFETKDIVWVANRDKPLPDAAGSKLEIAENGNLELYYGEDRKSLWSTSLTPSPETRVAELGDDGNLILKDGRSPELGSRLWKSFDHPTDTWLPGAPLGSGRRLVSWKSDDDPAPGMFSAELSDDGGRPQIVLKLYGSSVYWESGLYRFTLGNFETPSELGSLLAFKNQSNAIAELQNTNVQSNGSQETVFGMILMDHRRGTLYLLSSAPGQRKRIVRNMTEGFGFCGEFGIFNTSASGRSSSPCSCLPGFTPSGPSGRLGEGGGDWRCSRKSDLECEKKHDFQEISGIKFPNNGIPVESSSSDKECELECMRRCLCTAYAFNHTGTGCFIWEGSLLGLQHDISNKQNLHLRIAKGKNNTMEVIIGVVVPAVVLVFCGFLGFFYNRRAKHKETMQPREDLLSFDFNSTDHGTFLREFDLPIFSYASVSSATNSFSPQNKLGEGGFGPVYKGTLLNGQEIALKRLSQNSGQGFQEFRNEILLIAKLQHRNLVSLLGCCIDSNESILIYEYMPNKSLDFFLFGSLEQGTLDWKTRIHIVEGIAQGLLYLHEYSRVRIIHRDLKASNILLDDEMNPKISDFGMACIFGGGISQAHSNKIVGTFGYIAPEYALEGTFSTKSDVYSFGVLVLEIISGRRNTGFYKTDSLSLLGHAWDLWVSDRGVELVDGKAGYQAGSAALRYINVGLLCVQENPNDRPTMSSVVSMLNSEIAALPPPKRPAFSIKRLISYSATAKISDEEPYPSINGLTASVIEPR